jgi:hypothetical protein
MNRRLATPGAVLFVVGVVLMWWGAGVFRGNDNKIVVTPGFGGGGSGDFLNGPGGGASGSF